MVDSLMGEISPDGIAPVPSNSGRGKARVEAATRMQKAARGHHARILARTHSQMLAAAAAETAGDAGNPGPSSGYAIGPDEICAHVSHLDCSQLLRPLRDLMPRGPAEPPPAGPPAPESRHVHQSVVTFADTPPSQERSRPPSRH